MNEAWQLTVTHYSCACQTTEDSNSPSLTKLEERTLLVKEVSGKSSIRESDEHNVLLCETAARKSAVLKNLLFPHEIWYFSFIYELIFMKQTAL